MNTPVFNRRHAERFNQLLDDADGSGCRHTRSPLDEELAGLTNLGRHLSAVPAIDADSEFRTDLRAVLIATAEREGIGATATSAAADALGPDDQPARRRPAVSGHRARTRGAIIAAVAAGAIAVSGISTASDNALPGDPLYGMKRSTERAQMALSGSDLSRGQLFLDFARTRLSEAEALRDGDEGFRTLLDDMDADTRDGVKLLTAFAVQHKDEQPLDAITAFLAGQDGRLQELLGHTTGSEHERLVASAALLDTVVKRVGVLRRTLDCGPDPSGRTDALGVLPHACTAGSGRSGAAPGSGQRDYRPDRQVATPALASPAAVDPTSADSHVKPGPAADPAEQPVPTPTGAAGHRPLNRAQG